MVMFVLVCNWPELFYMALVPRVRPCKDHSDRANTFFFFLVNGDCSKCRYGRIEQWPIEKVGSTNNNSSSKNIGHIVSVNKILFPKREERGEEGDRPLTFKVFRNVEPNK